jgi:hypothetical protein
MVLQAATQIYAAYIQSAQVTSGNESEWMDRSIEEAIQLAKSIDDIVVSDNEMD